MRYSAKREIIKNAVINNRVHPTADDVYQIVRKTNPEISLGTVYRNLNQLTESGGLLKITVPGGPDRYDGILTEHQHAICEKCGKVEDFSYNISGLFSHVKQETGIIPKSVCLAIIGLCCDCADKIDN